VSSTSNPRRPAGSPSASSSPKWKQPLSATCIGTLCTTTDKPLRFYLDGQPYTGDPAQIELKAHQEVAIVYGTLPTGTTPPASFTFDPGE
jgi:hypothetical protein